MADRDYQFTGENHSDFAGSQVAAAGDVDGDGKDDFLIGADGNDEGGDRAGKSYLILAADLPTEGGDNISLADAHFSFTGEAAEDYASESIAAGGDIDGDGLGDLLFGSAYNDDAGTNAGKCYVVFGSGLTTSGSMSLGASDHMFTGRRAREELCQAGGIASGDVDGDGRSDVLFGEWMNDEWHTSWHPGKSYLVFGTTFDSLDTTIDVGGDGMDRDYDYGLVGWDKDARSGHSVVLADVNGDGLDDMLVSSPYMSAARGGIWVKYAVSTDDE